MDSRDLLTKFKQTIDEDPDEIAHFLHDNNIILKTDKATCSEIRRIIVATYPTTWNKIFLSIIQNDKDIPLMLIELESFLKLALGQELDKQLEKSEPTLDTLSESIKKPIADYFFLKGIEISERDLLAGLENFHDAAKRDHPGAKWQYAKLVITKDAKEEEKELKNENRKIAGSYLKESAKPGNNEAIVYLMEYYVNGNPAYNIEKNPTEASRIGTFFDLRKETTVAKKAELEEKFTLIKSQLSIPEVKTLADDPLKNPDLSSEHKEPLDTIPSIPHALRIGIETNNLATFEKALAENASGDYLHPALFKAVIQKGSVWTDCYIRNLTNEKKYDLEDVYGFDKHLDQLKELERICKTNSTDSRFVSPYKSIKEQIALLSCIRGDSISAKNKSKALQYYYDGAERGDYYSMIRYTALFRIYTDIVHDKTPQLVKFKIDNEKVEPYIKQYVECSKKLAGYSICSDSSNLFLAEFYIKNTLGKNEYQANREKGLTFFRKINLELLHPDLKPVYIQLSAAVNPENKDSESKKESSRIDPAKTAPREKISTGTISTPIQKTIPYSELPFIKITRKQDPVKHVDPALQPIADLSNHYAHWSWLAKGSWGERDKVAQIKQNCSDLFKELDNNPDYAWLVGQAEISAALQKTIASLDNKPQDAYLFCDNYISHTQSTQIAAELKSIYHDKEIKLDHLENYALCSVSAGLTKSAFVQGIDKTKTDNTFVSEAYIADSLTSDTDKLREFVFDQLESFHADPRNAGQRLVFEGNFDTAYLIAAASYCQLRGYAYRIEATLASRTGIASDASFQPQTQKDWRTWLTRHEKYPFCKLLPHEMQKKCEAALKLPSWSEEKRAESKEIIPSSPPDPTFKPITGKISDPPREKSIRTKIAKSPADSASHIQRDAKLTPESTSTSAPEIPLTPGSSRSH